MTKKGLFEKYDGDVFLYYGSILRDGYNQLSSIFEKKADKKHKVCIVLVTYGGDPDAGYRIARATKHHYDKFEILIPDICKSAGTLICIGADKLIFGDRGELGPLDIQLSKPDEMFESMSGLDIIQAINALENQLLDSFRTYLLDIRGGSRIKTRMAAEIATKLAEGFIGPIAARIDPVTLGEHQRAMQIAYDYGERLNNTVSSLLPDALIKLVSSYPSHGFVIDRKEARSLFRNVSAPDEATIEIYEWVRGIIDNIPYPNAPIIIDVLEKLKDKVENISKEMESENKSSDDGSNETELKKADGEPEDQSETNEQNGGESTQPKSGTGRAIRKRES